MPTVPLFLLVVFFNDTATTEIYTLSLHDALPISPTGRHRPTACPRTPESPAHAPPSARSEEHTSELQSRRHLVCRLLLEKTTGYRRTRSGPRSGDAHALGRAPETLRPMRLDSPAAASYCGQCAPAPPRRCSLFLKNARPTERYSVPPCALFQF